jgi:hypothetical protein
VTQAQHDGVPPEGLRPRILDSLRQVFLYPPEFRITPLPGDMETPSVPHVAVPLSAEASSVMSDRDDRILSEVATCLWYLKTKHFRQSWDTEDRVEDDPKARRALGRLNSCLAALKAGNIEIQDPTNKRYPPGSGHLMKPVQLQPTPGITVEKVVETVKPIVFRDGRLIQQGEVFVAVPEESLHASEGSVATPGPSGTSPASSTEDAQSGSLSESASPSHAEAAGEGSEESPAAPDVPRI